MGEGGKKVGASGWSGIYLCKARRVSPNHCMHDRVHGTRADGQDRLEQKVGQHGTLRGRWWKRMPPRSVRGPAGAVGAAGLSAGAAFRGAAKPSEEQQRLVSHPNLHCAEVANLWELLCASLDRALPELVALV